MAAGHFPLSGAILRRGRELDSPPCDGELACGAICVVADEQMSRCGTPRLLVVRPMLGWMSAKEKIALELQTLPRSKCQIVQRSA